MSDTGLRFQHEARVFPHWLSPGLSGIAGPLCWSITPDLAEVLIRHVKKEDLDACKWSDAETKNGIIGCWLSPDSEQTDKRKRRKTRSSDKDKDDGICLSGGSSLFVRAPGKLGKWNGRFSLKNLNIETDDTISALAGVYDIGHAQLLVWVGTALGQVHLVQINSESSIESELIYDPIRNQSILSRVFTPRKKKSGSSDVLGIVTHESKTVFLTRDGVVGHLEGRDASKLQTIQIQKGLTPLAIALDDQHRVLVLCRSDEDGRLSQWETNGKTFERVSDLIAVSYSSKVGKMNLIHWKAGHAFVTYVNEEDASSLKVVDLNSGEPILTDSRYENDPCVAFALIDEEDLTVLLRSGLCQTTRKLASQKRDKKLSPEKIDRFMTSIMSSASSIIASDPQLFANRAKYKMDVTSVMDRIRKMDEFMEIEQCTSRSHLGTSLAEALRHKLSRPVTFQHRERELRERIGLALVASVGLQTELDIQQTETVQEIQDIGEERAPTAQFLGESLFGAVECLNRDRRMLDQLFDDGFTLNLLARLEEVELLLKRLVDDAGDRTEDLEASMSVIESVFRGADEFSRLAGSKSELVERCFDCVEQCLNAYLPQLQQSQRSASERLRRVRFLCEQMMAVRRSPEALQPLLKLGLSQTADRSLRDLAEAAAKHIAEEYAEFDTLISACFATEEKDIATIERCLRKTEREWQGFPRVLLGWMLRNNRLKDAFALVESTYRSEPDSTYRNAKTKELRSHLIAELKANSSENKNQDYLWLAYVENGEWAESAGAVQGQHTPLGVLSAFVSSIPNNNKEENPLLRNQIIQMVRQGMGDTPSDVLDLFILALKYSKGTPRDKDMVWATTIKRESPFWHHYITESPQLNLSSSSTEGIPLFVQLARSMRERKEDSLLPGPDFFGNLKDLLPPREFSDSEARKLVPILKDLMNK